MQYQNLISLRKIAIHNRLSDDLDIYIENCYRYVSKTYNISLFELKDKMIPEQAVLIFMEDEMNDWDVQNILDVQAQLNTGDRAVIESSGPRQVSLSDDEWIAQQESLLKNGEKKAKQQEDIAKQTHKVIEDLTSSINAMTKSMGGT